MTAYTVMENYRHGLFTVFLLLYGLILTLNSLLVAVIHQYKDLHQPMNVFACMLSVNEIYGSSALLPSTMSLLLSDTHQVPVKWCLAQVFLLHTYAGAEFCILALMGYDRYLAICLPLHYHSIMSHSKVCRLVAFVGVYPFVVFAGYYSLTLQLRFCGKALPKLYCVNMELVKNSCSNASVYISIIGLVLILFMIIPQMILIVFSYVQISRVCQKLTKESQHVALKTCVPHLLSLVNYTIGALFEILQTRFDMSHVAFEIRIFLSLYFVIIPPAVNPVLYGFGTHMVRVQIMKLLIRYRILLAPSSKAVKV